MVLKFNWTEPSTIFHMLFFSCNSLITVYKSWLINQIPVFLRAKKKKKNPTFPLSCAVLDTPWVCRNIWENWNKLDFYKYIYKTLLQKLFVFALFGFFFNRKKIYTNVPVIFASLIHWRLATLLPIKLNVVCVIWRN